MLLETDKEKIGKKFREYRKRQNLTQFELAEKVGLNEKQISRIEQGQNYPTYTTFAKLIEVLEIDIKCFSKDCNDEDEFYRSELMVLIEKSDRNEIKIYTNTIKTLKNSLKAYKLS